MIAAFLALAVGSHRQVPTAGVGTVASAQIAQVVNWLPPDTETLTVETEPSHTLKFSQPGILANDMSLLACFSLPQHDMEAWPIDFQYIVDGSRNYRFPKSLGLCPFDGCAIVCLQPGKQPEAEELAKKYANHTGQIEGHLTYVVEKRGNPKWDDPWNWYVCFDGDMMFSATNKEFLIEVLKRKVATGSGRALPDSLEEWKYIDAGAPFFAVRHFTDRSKKMGGEVNMADPQMVGLAIWLSKDKKAVNVVSISVNKDCHKIAKGMWQGFLKQEQWGHTVDVTEIDGRTTRIVLDGQGDRAERPLFLLMAALGHPVFV